jgi:hypothetical protein
VYFREQEKVLVLFHIISYKRFHLHVLARKLFILGQNMLCGQFSELKVDKTFDLNNENFENTQKKTHHCFGRLSQKTFKSPK